MSAHLEMAQLLAIRDGDRSDPALFLAETHLAGCPICQAELDQLHQLTARLRALPQLSPRADVYPAVRARLGAARTERVWRRRVSIGMTALAAMAVWLIADSIMAPTLLNAEQEIAEVRRSSRILEQRLAEWDPDQRPLDGSTAIFVISLKDRIAEIDQALRKIDTVPQPPHISLKPVFNPGNSRMQEELRLWRERERLMDALLKAHVNQSVRIAF